MLWMHLSVSDYQTHHSLSWRDSMPRPYTAIKLMSLHTTWFVCTPPSTFQVSVDWFCSGKSYIPCNNGLFTPQIDRGCWLSILPSFNFRKVLFCCFIFIYSIYLSVPLSITNWSVSTSPLNQHWHSFWVSTSVSHPPRKARAVDIAG